MSLNLTVIPSRTGPIFCLLLQIFISLIGVLVSRPGYGLLCAVKAGASLSLFLLFDSGCFLCSFLSPFMRSCLNTQKIERKHLSFRARLKRLACKTICFSKSYSMHNILLDLFINVAKFGCQFF